jgi:hypothetical protein
VIILSDDTFFVLLKVHREADKSAHWDQPQSILYVLINRHGCSSATTAIIIVLASYSYTSAALERQQLRAEANAKVLQ